MDQSCREIQVDWLVEVLIGMKYRLFEMRFVQGQGGMQSNDRRSLLVLGCGLSDRDVSVVFCSNLGSRLNA